VSSVTVDQSRPIRAISASQDVTARVIASVKSAPTSIVSTSMNTFSSPKRSASTS
jgi:hypothetical protein